MSKPKSEKLCPGVEQIPFEALERLGAIFEEGRVKYGLDNWKSSPDDQEYNTERTRHAIRHLMLYANGDRQEDHLAKVMWYCVTTIWRTNHNTERRSYSSASSSSGPSESSGTMDPSSWTGTYAAIIEPTIYTPEEYAAKQAKEQPSE